MKTLTDNQLNGNWAEHYISEELSRCKCLVRQVQQGNDIGIDLYCESTIQNKTSENQPFLHFFVQVKYGKKIGLKNKDMEIKYWEKQPVPVFIFHVYDKSGNFSIYSALHYILGKKNKEDYYYVKNGQDKLKDFFDDNGFLMRNYYEWSLLKGNITPIPKHKKNKFDHFYPGKMHLPEYRVKIRKTIFLALWRYCEDNFLNVFDIYKFRFKPGKTKADLDSLKYSINSLCNFDKDFKKYEVSKALLALWHYSQKEYKIADEYICNAIRIIDNQLSICNKKDKVGLKMKCDKYKKYESEIKKQIQLCLFNRKYNISID